MEKRYNFRLYPTKTQEKQIRRNFGSVRFVYNYFLNKRIERFKADGSFYSYGEAAKDLTALKKTAGYEWLREADSHSLQNALKKMDRAYAAFFRRVRETRGAPGFPRFKRKRETRRSYTSQSQAGRAYIELGERAIKLPKLGLVKCRVSRQAEGRIVNASVFQVPSGKYYVSVCCTDIEARELPRTGQAVGLHLGIKDLAIASDGRTFENGRFLEKAQKKISRLQRRLSRKSNDSASREKARIALAKAHERMKNQRTDALQKLTTQLTRDYDLICVRGEELRKMARRRPFARYLADAAWGELISKLRYKCGWYGKTLAVIDPSYPSTRICGACGHKSGEASAGKRTGVWTCPECGATHQRARNAAANTLEEGRRLLSTA
ncbi:MAG: transposase [Gracilibacteraceae bacterium]|jgi:putative transposase|nr:transposase [Gracilibacteraceae bacterium]